MPWTKSSLPRGTTGAWKRARSAALLAAGGLCQIRGPGCTTYATAVDHIYGTRADPNHRYLQAVCKTCHHAKTAKEAAAARWGPTDPRPRPRTQW